MKVKRLLSLLLILSLAAIGCDSAKTGENGDNASGDGGTETVDFKIEKPPSFEGEFNPSGLRVGTKIGDVAPEIEGKDAEGVTFKLSDYRGKVVVLDFWGDW